MQAGDNLKSYFWRLHKKTGGRISVRAIRAAWQGQQLSRRAVEALREAQGQDEASELANQLEAVANGLRAKNEAQDQPEIDAIINAVRALRGMVSTLRNMDRAGADGD